MEAQSRHITQETSFCVHLSTLVLNAKENRLETIFPLGYTDSMLLWDETMSRIELWKNSVLWMIPSKPLENMSPTLQIISELDLLTCIGSEL